MKEVAENLFEPLREWVGGPIKINSFFRIKIGNRTQTIKSGFENMGCYILTHPKRVILMIILFLGFL